MHRALRIAPFRRLWEAGLFSSLAGWALGIALAVHVFELTHSPLASTVLLMVSLAPAVLLGSAAGVVADRRERTRLLKLVSWSRVVLASSLVILGDGHLSALYTVAFLQAAAMQFFLPAEQATSAALVPAHDLPAAAGAISIANNVTRLAAPALGGLLMTTLGFAWTAAVVASMLAAAATLLSGMPRSAVRPSRAENTFLTDWKAGLSELRSNPSTRSVAVLQVLDALKEGALSALFPVVILGVVGASAAAMGAVHSSFAITAIAAGPALAWVTRRFGYRSPIAWGASGSGGLLFLLILWPSASTAFLSFGLAGFPFTISWVAGNTMLLLGTREDRRARSLGTLNGIYAAATLLSAALAGVLAEHLGPIRVLAVGAGIQLVAGPVFILMTRHLPPELSPTSTGGQTCSSGPDGGTRTCPKGQAPVHLPHAFDG